METTKKQKQQFKFRAVTITDLTKIVKLYQEQKTKENSILTNQFGLPFYVAELNQKIVGYSFATASIENNYKIKTLIDSYYFDDTINKSLAEESVLYFKNEWQNNSNKNLSKTINQLVKWLNNSSLQ